MLPLENGHRQHTSAYPQTTNCRLSPLPHLGGAAGAHKTARRAPKPGNHCMGYLAQSSEGWPQFHPMYKNPELGIKSPKDMRGSPYFGK